jgi:hypothetical protein
MTINPAFEIPLTSSEKIALGELCVIQGQIEDLLNRIVIAIAWRKGPLDAPFTVDATWVRKRHAPLGTSVREWIAQVRKGVVDTKLLQACETIYLDIQTLCEDRNNFIHATYGIWLDTGGIPAVVPLRAEVRADPMFLRLRRGPAAKRSRTNLSRDVSELPAVRDKAAEISVRLHEIHNDLLGEPR